MRLIFVEDNNIRMSTNRSFIKSSQEQSWYDTKMILTVLVDEENDTTKIYLNNLK